jgi:hypothetical protein
MNTQPQPGHSSCEWHRATNNDRTSGVYCFQQMHKDSWPAYSSSCAQLKFSQDQMVPQTSVSTNQDQAQPRSVLVTLYSVFPSLCVPSVPQETLLPPRLRALSLQDQAHCTLQAAADYHSSGIVPANMQLPATHTYCRRGPVLQAAPCKSILVPVSSDTSSSIVQCTAYICEGMGGEGGHSLSH